VKKVFRSEEDRRQVISEIAQANKDEAPIIIMEKLDHFVGAPEIVTERKCACGHKYPIHTFPMVNTGVVPTALLNLCKNCIDGGAEKELVHFCCVNCKEVFAHAPPHKVVGGFEYKPGGYYHTSACPNCSSAKGAPCLEVILFYKKNKIPYTTESPT
jgi:hypothetical protein